MRFTDEFAGYPGAPPPRAGRGAPWRRRRPRGRAGGAGSAARRALGQLAELQWDLGGLVYEMARRDHFRLDVVARQAAKLQAVDAELGEVERLLHLERAGAGGNCPACGALHARGAVYCWQCGTDLMARDGRRDGEPAPAALVQRASSLLWAAEAAPTWGALCATRVLA